MRRSLLVVVSIVTLAAMASLLPAQNSDRPPDPPQWESRILLLTDVVGDLEPPRQVVAIEEKFNELGRDRWEFCQIHNSVAIFKRAKR
jgi:hypothetical protein